MSGESDKGELSTPGHWNEVWSGEVRPRLPAGHIVATRDFQRLLRRYVRRGDRFLELGCAPGKMLAWVAAAIGAEVSGLDYSEPGMATARRLFAHLGLAGDLRCEGLDDTSFPTGSFDVVYSSGLIEHFADPRAIVDRHLSFVRAGGLALITIPDYSGIYGRLQQYFDAELLSIHNLTIMNCAALLELVPRDRQITARAYRYGRFSPWLLTPSHRWPAPLAALVSHLATGAAWLQPMQIAPLCPTLVLEVRRH